MSDQSKKRKVAASEDPGSPEVDLKRHDSLYLEAGDVELLSSDSVLFRIHQYQLKTWSPVLRVMLEDCASSTSTDIPRLEFTDLHIENSSVVSLVLMVLLHRSDIDACLPARNSADTAINAVLFSDKYDIEAYTRLARQSLSLHVARLDKCTSVDFGHFLLALALKDNRSGVRLLWRWWQRLHRDHAGQLQGSAFGNLPFVQYCTVPNKIMWVLHRLEDYFAAASYPTLKDAEDELYFLLSSKGLSFSLNP